MTKVFISHAKEDRLKAIALFDQLKAAGFSPWFDEFHLLPGDQWEVMIKKAIAQCDICIVCLSKNAVNKVGYVQVEQKIALKEALRYPTSKIFLVPVRFDDCVIPIEFEHHHCMDCCTLEDMYDIIAGLKKYIHRELGNQVTIDNYILHYESAFRQMEPKKLREMIFPELQRNSQHPELHLLYAISWLKGLELAALNIDESHVGKAEEHLDHALNDPRCRSTALLTKAFIHFDFYERRHRSKSPPAKILFQQIIEHQQLPDQLLVKYLKFSPSFSRKVKILLQWLKK